jgi:hypothetical protein
MPTPHLTELYRIQASGARAVEPFDVSGLSLLAVPQLAVDVAGEPPNMNGGDSNTDLLLLLRTADGYVPFQRLLAPGGEDAEFFRIDDRAFLAVASIRSGTGPYEYATESRLFEWTGTKFEIFQTFSGFAAKQWRHFTIGDRHFLALAQGVLLPDREADNRPSEIFHWDGQTFVPFQTIPSSWAYNWHAFTIGGEHYLAHADNVSPSMLYHWDGEQFVAQQQLAGQHGRAFADFTVDGAHYLIVGCLQSPSRVLRWDGTNFVEHQVLDGLGSREFAVVTAPGGPFVVRVNFILGTPVAPQPELNSQLYQWRNGELVVVEEFPTTGGVDVAVFSDGQGTLVAVAHALSADIRFATSSVVYRFRGEELS